MMDATMKKSFYDECSDIYNKKENKKGKKNSTILINIYYNLKLRLLAKKMNLKEHFEKNKDICGGKVVIKNTRISPKTITLNVLNNIDNKVDSRSLERAINKTVKEYPALNKDIVIFSMLYCFIYRFR